MCFKKPKFDSVMNIKEELEEGGGIVFDGGLDVEEDDDHDDDMWGHMGLLFAGPQAVWTGTMQVRKALLTHHCTEAIPIIGRTLRNPILDTRISFVLLRHAQWTPPGF